MLVAANNLADQAAHLLQDPTGQVDLSNPGEIEAAICAILGGLYADSYDAALLTKAIQDLISAYRGNYPGLLASDTLYHDLRHALETGLTAARLLDGYAKSIGPDNALQIDAHHGVLCVLLALYHDVGLLRTDTEAQLWGPALIPIHEERGAEFMQRYLARSLPAASAEKSRLIMATKFIFQMPESWSSFDRLLASIIASADLLSQFSDRCYLEKCRDFLFVEFSACGLAGTLDSPYPDRETLLADTPSFFSNVIYRRLDDEFQGAYRLLELHTGKGNHWLEAIQRNLGFLENILSSGEFYRLRRTRRPFN